MKAPLEEAPVSGPVGPLAKMHTVGLDLGFLCPVPTPSACLPNVQLSWVTALCD